MLVNGLTADRDIIVDFEDGIDFFQGVAFGSLTVTQVGANTEITNSATLETLAIVIGTDVADIDALDFI